MVWNGGVATSHRLFAALPFAGIIENAIALPTIDIAMLRARFGIGK